MFHKENRRLRVGVLGCGPIAQLAHLESCVKARNADLYAICDAAPDLLARSENGSVLAKTFNPWYFRASEVEIFHEKDATSRKPLGADGHFFRRQVEGLADTALNGAPMRGAVVEDGIASIRAMVAIARSVETGDRVELASVTGTV